MSAASPPTMKVGTFMATHRSAVVGVAATSGNDIGDSRMVRLQGRPIERAGSTGMPAPVGGCGLVRDPRAALPRFAPLSRDGRRQKPLPGPTRIPWSPIPPARTTAPADPRRAPNPRFGARPCLRRGWSRERARGVLTAGGAHVAGDAPGARQRGTPVEAPRHRWSAAPAVAQSPPGGTAAIHFLPCSWSSQRKALRPRPEVASVIVPSGRTVTVVFMRRPRT